MNKKLVQELKYLLRREADCLKHQREFDIKQGHLVQALVCDTQADYAEFLLDEIECYEKNGRWL